MKKKKSVEDAKDWVQDNIIIKKNGCWEWRGVIGKKPLRAKIGGWYQELYNLVSGQASRAVYALYKPNEFDPTLLVLHTEKCNPKTAYKCVCPDHMYQGTYSQNARDKVRFGLQMFGEDNPTSVHKNADVRKIKRLHKKGLSVVEIKEKVFPNAKFNIDPEGYWSAYQLVRMVVSGKAWKTIK